MRPLGERRSL